MSTMLSTLSQEANLSLQAAVDAACAAYPTEANRIQRGAEIVQRSGVRRTENGTYNVGIFHYYPQVSGKNCPCPDSAMQHAPAGRCKHRWGLTLWKRMQATSVPTLRQLEFYATHATLGNGVARIREDGACWFEAEEQAGEWLAATWDELALGGRKDWIDAAYATA